MQFSKLLKLPALLLFLTAMVSSCETIIDADLPPYEPALVCNAFFGNDTSFTIELYQDKHILDNDEEYYTVSDASVVLYENGEWIGQATEMDNFSGLYNLDYLPLPGATYQLSVSKEGFTSIESTDAIPVAVSNVSTDKIGRSVSEYGEEMLQLTYSINDVKGSNYYEVLIYAIVPTFDYVEEEDSIYYVKTGSYRSEVYFTKVGAALNEFDQNDMVTIFSDELFDGGKHTQTVEFSYYYWNPTDDAENDAELYLEVRNISESMYRYKVSRIAHENAMDNPFSEAAMVYNNIEGGFGIFAGYHSEPIGLNYHPN